MQQHHMHISEGKARRCVVLCHATLYMIMMTCTVSACCQQLVCTLSCHLCLAIVVQELGIRFSGNALSYYPSAVRKFQNHNKALESRLKDSLKQRSLHKQDELYKVFNDLVAGLEREAREDLAKSMEIAHVHRTEILWQTHEALTAKVSLQPAHHLKANFLAHAQRYLLNAS